MINRRSAYSLVEMVVVMTLIGTVLVVVGLTMHAMYRADRELRDDLTYRGQLERFAAQLRSDAHPARSASVRSRNGSDLPAALLLTLTDQRKVEYTEDVEGICRVVRRGETVLHRETYRLPRSLSASWQTAAGPEQREIIVELRTRDSGRPSDRVLPRRYRIEAAVGVLPTRWTPAKDRPEKKELPAGASEKAKSPQSDAAGDVTEQCSREQRSIMARATGPWVSGSCAATTASAVPLTDRRTMIPGTTPM